MITTIESLADQLNILNANSREILYKLYLWDTVTDVDTIPVTLRVPDAPYYQTFNIPTKSAASSYMAGAASSQKTSKNVKNWGKYSTNEDLQNPITFKKTVSTDVNYMYYDGPDIEGAVSIEISDEFAEIGDTFEFICSVASGFPPSDSALFKFTSNAISICKLGNAPLSTVYDAAVSTQSFPIVYKIKFQYVPDENMNNSWQVFDLYAMPTFRYDGQGTFKKASVFRDPTHL